MRKISDIFRQRLSEDRKSSEKSIKSYEIELEKVNNLISQFEKKIEEKDQ